MFFNQQEFEVRCEWGKQGVVHLAPISDVVIIVDVLSFSTSVCMAVNRGAVVFPYRGRPEDLAAYAAGVGAVVAEHRRTEEGGYSLSPASLQTIGEGERLVLPSPNGSTLSLGAGSTPVLAGCLRNAKAVAQAASQYGPHIAVIAAGEQWRPEGGLRPALEDQLGAGAILSYLTGNLSPEAKSAALLFEAVRPSLGDTVRHSVSGKELIARGFAEDVQLAVQLNVSNCVPILQEGAYRRTL